MPFLAPKGAIRCDATTQLDARDVVEIVQRAMTHDSVGARMLASPDRWEPASPPAEADAAWVRVRNKREERLHATSRGGMQDSNASLAVGTVVALAIEPGGDGSVSVQLWTSTVNKHGSSGRIGAALEIRKRMRRFAKELASRDPTATVAHAEDG